MPLYLRKSVAAGPFRFNFSKGGVGVSVGVKGLRIGTGPRGHYVRAGWAGTYYRSMATRPGRSGSAKAPVSNQGGAVSCGVAMIEIESADVAQLRDSAFSDVLHDINTKSQQWRMAIILCCVSALLAWLSFIVVGPPALMAAPVLGLLGYFLGDWLDSYRRTTVLYYEFDPELKSCYRAVAQSFDALAQCDRKWHVEAGGAVQDLTTWKRNAGATHLISKTETRLMYILPRVIRCNITPPAIQVGKQVIYFLPDVALIEHNGKMGAVSYSDLRIKWQESNFIEDGRVPADAQIVGRTWKHPNKNGGPDRRFKSNYEIPVCRYEAIHLASDSGLNELLQFSKTGCAQVFSTAIKSMSGSTSRAEPKLSLL